MAVHTTGCRPTRHQWDQSANLPSEHDGRMQTRRRDGNAGSRLNRNVGWAGPARKPAFQPYWGKPAVRNERGDGGNVDIIRSPVRATVLPSNTPKIYSSHAMEDHENSLLHEELSGLIRQTAFETHRYFGPGFLAKVSENALVNRLRRKGLDVKAQYPIVVHDDDGTVVGDYDADLFVAECVV